MRVSSKKRKVGGWCLLVAAISAFLCFFSSLEVEGSNVQPIASLLAEPTEQVELASLIEEHESLDESEKCDREDLEEALPGTAHNRNQVSARQSVSPSINKQWIVPQVKVVWLPINPVGANESYYSVPLCFLYCSLLI